MVLAHLLIFLPAFALCSKDSVSIVPAEDLKVCEYFDARIIRLGEIINEELQPDVDVHSDLYITLEESKLCDTVGYVAIPECVAKNEGDECVARKTSEMITKSLRAVMKAEKIKEVPSGEKFFATCKHIGYKNVLKTFKSARSLMSAECGLPGQKHGNRHARNVDLLPALLLAGSYDPSSIWFQYFLCKDIDLYCYFFTQGWTQGQYGQYYLYDNLLDDTNGLFKGSADSSNLATIALLGGLGAGIGQPSGYYAPYGAPAAATSQGRKRRQATNGEVDCMETPDHHYCNRRERDVDCNADHPDYLECMRRKRSTGKCDADHPDYPDCKRRKRSTCDANHPNYPDCKRSKRSTLTSTCDANHPDYPDCMRRKRSTCDQDHPDYPDCKRSTRSTLTSTCDANHPDYPDCMRRKRSTCDQDHLDYPNCKRSKREDCGADDNCERKRREACEACDDNPDSTDCNKC